MSNELYREFPKLQLEYRLYYNELGRPTAMSCADHPVGNYVVITQQQYDAANYRCRVKNGTVIFDLDSQVKVQLRKSTSGVAVVKGHASLVVEPTDTYKDIEFYDRNS